MDDRPQLTAELSAREFAAWYWLKQELIAFCQENRIQTSGSKLELQDRIAAYLGGASLQKPSSRRSRAGVMPLTFTLDTVIEEGWRCGPALGAFMRQAAGRGFRFNAAVRDFIHNGEGKTLAEAAICYHNSIRPGQAKAAIPTQLEYNQHFRDYFRQHPGASKGEAIAAWWEKRCARIEQE